MNANELLKREKKSTGKAVVKPDDGKYEIKKRGLVGAWKGKIKIIGDIDNVFNFSP